MASGFCGPLTDERPQSGALVAVAWSLIGWVIALVMSLQSHRIVAFSDAPVRALQAGTSMPAGRYRAADGTGQQCWDGVQWPGNRAP